MSTATLTQVITVSIVGLIAGLALLTRLNKRTRPTLQNFPTGGLQ